MLVLNEVEGWLSLEVIELLQDLCKKRPTNSDILEVGTWKGKSAIAMATVLDRDSILHCVDTFIGSQEHQHLYGEVNTLKDFQENLKAWQIENKVRIHIGTSKDVAEHLDDDSLGLIFIDGSHDYADVLQDYQILFPKLKIGGYMAFHDSKWPGVRKVLWEEVFPTKNTGLIKRIEDTTYFQKTPHSYYLIWNLIQLFVEQRKQDLKRYKRKARKKYFRFNEY